MNEAERQELAAIRAELENLRRLQSRSQTAYDALFERMRALERRLDASSNPETGPKPAPPSMDRIGEHMMWASRPPPSTFPERPAAVPPAKSVPTAQPTHTAEPVLPAPPVLQPLQAPEPPAVEPSGAAEETTAAATSDVERSPAPSVPSSATTAAPPFVPPSPPGREEPEAPPDGESWEVRIGTYWVPRVGITMLLTGLVFLAYYYHARLPLWTKVLGMYSLCGICVGLGAWLERKYEILARVLFAGGLAGVYFVTYALHYVPPLRVIDSAAFCGVLLLAIVVVMVGLAQIRGRPWLAGMAILLGFYTSAISDVTSFTLGSNCLLAAGALYLMLVCDWVPLTGLSLLGTYGTYLYWLLRGGEPTTAHFKIWFLLLYWALFTLAVFLARPGLVESTVRNVFASVNNLLAFGFLTHALWTHHLAAQHWKLSAWFGAALAGLAWIARRQFKEDGSTFATYLITGLGLLTLALVEKFTGYQLVAALAVEAGLLVVLGHFLDQAVFRWFGAGTQALCVGFIAFHGIGTTTTDAHAEIAAWFAVVLGYGMALLQHWQTRPDHGPLQDRESERTLAALLQVLANAALLLTTYQYVHPPWFAPAVAAEGLVILVLGHIFGMPVFRWFCAGFQTLAVLVLLIHFGERADHPAREWAGWLSIAFAYTAVLIQHWRSRLEPSEPADATDEQVLAKFLSIVATVGLLIATWDFVRLPWRIPALAAEATVLLTLGHRLRDPLFRWMGAAFQAVCVIFLVANHRRPGTDETERAVATWLGVGLGYVIALIQHWQTRRDRGRLRDDESECHLALGLSLLANLGLVLANWDFLPEPWRATATALECGIIASAAGFLGAGRMVLSSQMLLVVAYASFAGGLMDHWSSPAPIHLPVALVAVSLGCAWFTDRRLSESSPYAHWIRGCLDLYLVASAAVVVLSLAQRLDASWHLWTMLSAAVAAQLIGWRWRNVSWRWISLTTGAAALVVFFGHEVDGRIDWDRHSVVAAHGLALALLVLEERLLKARWAAGARDADARQTMLSVLVVAVALLLLHCLWRAASREYLTAVWTVGAFGLFGLGLGFQERKYRLAGLSVVGLSVARAVVYDFWQIHEPLFRILSFIALGVILLVLGYLYARFRDKIVHWL